MRSTAASHHTATWVFLTILGGVFAAGILVAGLYLIYRAAADVVRGPSRFALLIFLIPASSGILIAHAIGRSFDVAVLIGLVLGAVVSLVYVMFFWKGS